jgi:hypothetical protein
MADRYLIETSATDGYLLEDGSGVLILDVAITDASAEVAAATVAGNVAAAGVSPTAGAAAATATANAATTTVQTNAGVAAATADGRQAAAGVSPTAGVASATATAMDASVLTSKDVDAGLASAIATANAASENVAPTPGVATATAAANPGSVNIQPSANLATAITLGSSLLEDTFTRTVAQDGLGTSDSGYVYSFDGASYGHIEVDGSAALVTGTSPNGADYLTDSTGNPLPQTSSGFFQIDLQVPDEDAFVQIGDVLPINSSDVLVGQGTTSGWEFNVSGYGLSDPFVVSGSPGDWVRYQIVSIAGEGFRFKVWNRTTSSEPDWSLVTQDNNSLGSTFRGLDIGVNVVGGTVRFDNLYLIPTGALDATVETTMGTDANAEVAGVAATANQSAAGVRPNAEGAAAIAAAYSPDASLLVNAGVAAASAGAYDATVSTATFVDANAESAAAIAAAYGTDATIAPTAGRGSATATARNATTTSTGPVNVNAGLASVSATAYGATVKQPTKRQIQRFQHVNAYARLAQVTARVPDATVEWNDDETAIALLI